MPRSLPAPCPLPPAPASPLLAGPAHFRHTGHTTHTAAGLETHGCSNVMALSGRLSRPLNRTGGIGGVRRARAGLGHRGWGGLGIVGPAVFTGAWIVSSLRQTGHAAADI